MSWNRLFAIERWSEVHRDVWLDLVRVFLGVGLVVKGISFVADRSFLAETMHSSNVSFMAVFLAHVVVAAHVVGGAMLAVGLLTRLAAVAQVPMLAGAIVLVHAREGLFTRAQTLEFTVLVLFLLVVFTFAGAGRFSVDHWMAKNEAAAGRRAKAERPV